MIRKLSLAVLFTLGSLPLSVYSIGLGELKTYSALNQNFRGEIRLLSVPRGELDTLRVKLASREAFAKTGAEYLHVLSLLKFEAVRRKDGSAVILVTSSNAIREPFLDFLVEMNWPNGRLLREYTVLLDPPLTTKRRSGQINKAKVVREKQVVATPTRAPVEPAVVKQEILSPAAGMDAYGPVAPNETLWKVAGKLKPGSISHHQMMMALYSKNPDAFVNADINQLKKGSMLKVPEVGEIKTLNRKEAIALFNQHESNLPVDIADTPDTPAISADTPDTPAISEATTDTGVVEPQPEQVDEEARLQIASARPEGLGEAGASESGIADDASEEDIRYQLMLARENIETSRLETDALKETVTDMEIELEEMQRLLTLQDDQLAYLRARLLQGEDESTIAVDALADASAAETQLESAVLNEQDQELTEIAAVGDAETALVTATGEPETAQLTDSGEPNFVEVAGDTDLAEAAATPDPASADKLAGTEPDPATVADEPVKTITDNGYLMSWLENNLVMLSTAAGGLFGMGALLALLRGSRRKKLQAEDITADNEEVLPDTMQYQAGATSDIAVEQESLTPRVASTKGMQTLEEDTTEVDPIAAADVYITYDRYPEAQKTLENAIDAGSDSLPIYHKLLEVYFKTENKEEFSALADRMVRDGLDKKDSEIWGNIREMGKKIDRFNPLFWAATATPLAAEETELAADLDSDIKAADPAEKQDGESLDALDKLDLDLSSFGMDGIDESDDIPGLGTATEEGDVELAFGESESDVDVADLGELEEIILDATDEAASERNEEITFAEPLADIEIGDEVATKMELANAYVDMGDNEGAISILKEVLEVGTGDQVAAASELMSQLKS